MENWQAALFGFPNPLLGIVGFAIVITVAMAVLAHAKFARWFWLFFQLGITLAAIFIVWLWSQALFVLNLLCPFCMIVWAMMIPLFLVTTARNIVHGVLPAPDWVKRIAAQWTWTIVVLVYIAVIASVFFRFLTVFFPSNA